MVTVRKLATRRLAHNKSRSVLTAVALCLTTALLMALGCSAIGLVDFQRKTVAFDVGNTHATLRGVSATQGQLLEQNPAVESLVLKEPFADIVHGSLNAALNYTDTRKAGIMLPALTDGRMPQRADEIAGPPSLFQRLGAEPAIGEQVTISFRVHGEGEIVRREFTITGLQEQVDLSVLDVSDARIAFGAAVSRELVERYLSGEDRYFSAQIRVAEQGRSYEEIEGQIHAIAADIGVNELDVSLNGPYLMWMTDPGSESALAMAALGLLVILLGGLVIYNIFYVSVISNIQELGKLKALGASRRQMKGLLLTEGLVLSAIALPAGLLLGYLSAAALFAVLRAPYGQDIQRIAVFSLPVTLLVLLAVAATTCLSLLRPMKLASAISPVEAMRYQEQAPKGQRHRKTRGTISLTGLSLANLSRNKKRTGATVLTMGLTCVLFLAISTVLNNISVEEYARQTLTRGEFMLSLNYRLNDTAYPENNLLAIQEDNPLGPAAQERIAAIPGVTGLETRSAVTASIDHPNYPSERISIGSFSRADTEMLRSQLRRGTMDYDQLVAQNGILFTWDAFFDEYGFQIGDTISLTFHSVEQDVPLQAVLAGSTTTSRNEFWMPEELIYQIFPDGNLTELLYVYAEDGAYGTVKAALQEIEGESLPLALYSLDEETRIAASALSALKRPIYGLLLIVGVISFISLINTMITSILTRKRELGILQAIGLTDRQLRTMLQNEGMLISGGALLCGLTLGNLIGWIVVRVAMATDIISITSYRYPIAETLVLIAAVALGQLCVTLFISRYIHRETLVSRMSAQN